MRYGLFVFFVLFLTACTLKEKQFNLPEKVSFQGKNYVKVTSNRIDEMQHSLYLPDNSAKDPENWTQGILFFLDKNSQKRSLAERVTLRQQVFAQQKDTKASVHINGEELRSEVIYPPTERFNDVLLEVSRGRNLQCGYAQIQVSDKRSISAKNLQNLTAYQASLIQLAQQLANMPWQIHCQ